MSGIPSKISAKYTELFVDTDALKRKLHEKGTMPADIKAIKEVIAAKLSDKQFMEGLMNDYLKGGEARISL
jgi:hypothetical protein